MQFEMMMNSINTPIADKVTLFNTELQDGDILVVGMTQKNSDFDTGCFFHVSQLLSIDLKLKAEGTFYMKPHYPELPKLYSEGKLLKIDFRGKPFSSSWVDPGFWIYNARTQLFQEAGYSFNTHQVLVSLIDKVKFTKVVNAKSPRKADSVKLNGVDLEIGDTISIGFEKHQGEPVAKLLTRLGNSCKLSVLLKDIKTEFVVDGVSYMYNEMGQSSILPRLARGTGVFTFNTVTLQFM